MEIFWGMVYDIAIATLQVHPPSRSPIPFLPGNAEDLGRSYSFCCQLRDRFQVHVLAVEYPGYGVCPGVATGPSVMENAFSALHFATQSGLDPERRVGMPWVDPHS